MSDTPSTSAKDRLLDVAVELLTTEGESALRVSDVAKRAGVAVGLINHHFGGRDGLIAAAQAARFTSVHDAEVNYVLGLLGEDIDRDALVQHVAKLAADGIADRSRLEHRLSRTSALAAAHGRPDLLPAMAAAASGRIDMTEQVVRGAQAAGFARLDLDPRAVATFIQSVVFGLVLANLDQRPTDEQAFAAVVAAIVESLLAPPEA